MKKIGIFVLTLVLLLPSFGLVSGAQSGQINWYCTRQKAHRQAIAAPELRFVEEFGGYYIDHGHGDGDPDKVVYLTFDMGYENGNVERVLDTLKETGTPAAFFVLKHPVEQNTDLLQRMVSEGHLVCNHTAHHPNLARATKEEIKAELEALERACAEAEIKLSPYFRPPEGSFSREMLTSVRELGYKTVFWSFAYADWDNDRQPSPSVAMRCVLDNLHNGAVLLLHPTSATNAEILPQLIAQIKAEGYRFGTLEELCGD